MQVKNTFGCKFLSVFLCLSMLLAPVVTLADTMLTAETGSSVMTVDDAVTVIEGQTLTTPLYRLVEKASDIDGDKTYAFVSSKAVDSQATFLKYATELEWNGTSDGKIYNLPVDIVAGDTVLLAGTYVSAPSAQEAYDVYEWYIKNTTGFIYTPKDMTRNKTLSTSNINAWENSYNSSSRGDYVRINRLDANKVYMAYAFSTQDAANKGITDTNSVISVKCRWWGGTWTDTDGVFYLRDKDENIIAAYTIPATANDGSWKTYTVDMKVKGISPLDVRKIEFRPFGNSGSSINTTDPQYFDIAYVGFFTSEDEAADYSKKNPLSAIHVASHADLAKAYSDDRFTAQIFGNLFVRYKSTSAHNEHYKFIPYPKNNSGYMMIRYRTNLPQEGQVRAINIQDSYVSVGETSTSTFVSDGKWHTAVFDIRSFKTNAYNLIRLDLTPKTGATVDYTSYYFDIATVANFGSAEEAQAAGDSLMVADAAFTGADIYNNMSNSVFSGSGVNLTLSGNAVKVITHIPDTTNADYEDSYIHFGTAWLNACANRGNIKYAVIRYKTSEPNNNKFTFYYGYSGGGASASGTWVTDGQWHSTVVEFSTPMDSGTGYVRFDPFDYEQKHVLNSGCSIEIESITFFKDKEDANTYANDLPLLKESDSTKYSYTVNSANDTSKYLYGEYGAQTDDTVNNRVVVKVGSTKTPVFLPTNGGTLRVFDVSAVKSDFATLPVNGASFNVYEKVADAGEVIPAVKAWLIDDWGSVAVGVKGVSTGAYLKVWSGDNVFDVPVTTDMLYDKNGNAVSTATAGEQTGLVVKYLGVEIYKDFTLNVVTAKDFITSSNGIFKLVDPIDPHGAASKSIKNNTQYMLVNDSESGYAKVLSLQFDMTSGGSCGVVPRSSYVHEIEVDGEKQYYVVPVGGAKDVWTTEFPSYTDTPHPKLGSLGSTLSTFFFLKSSSNTYLRYTGTGPALAALEGTGTNPGWLPTSSTLYAQDLIKTDSGFFWCEMPETKISTKSGDATIVKGTGLACFGTTIGLKSNADAADTGIDNGNKYEEWRGLHYANEINNFTTRNPADGYITANANMTPYDRVFYYEKDTTVTKMTIYVDKTDVAVGYGAAGADITGANLVITTHKKDGTFSVSRVPVTMDMLSTSGSSGKTAVSTTSSPDDTITFKKVEVTYQDTGVGTLDTLTVTAEEKGKPTYPNPGSVIITKELDTATHNYNATGTARLELSVTGVPVSSGADVVIAIDNSGSMDTEKLSDGRTRRQAAQDALKQALTSFASSGKDIAVSVVTFDGYDLIDAGYVVNASRYNVTADGKLNTSTYRVDTNCDSNLESDTAQFLAAGFSALIPHVNDRFVEPGELTTDKINSIASNYVNAGGGTNYDRGLELAYETLNARQKQNALEGKKRDSYLILMGDGDTLQYNYLGISGNSSVDAGLNQAMLKGELDDNGDGAAYIKDIYGAASYTSNGGYNINHTGETFSSLPTHPYYDTHYNKYGASWMAEAIKGDTDKKYMVIDPDADPKDEYLTYVNGLGATVYTIGFGVLTDSQISNMQNFMNAKKATGYVTGEVLRKISSDFDLENAKSVVSDGKIIKDTSVIYSDNQYTYFTVTDIGGVFKTIADKIAVAGNATFTDEMSEYVDLQMKKATAEDVAPVIYVKEYETYKYSEIDTVVDGVYVTADLVGKIKKGCEGGKVIEEVTFSADGTSAASNKLTGEIISDNKINASTFTYDIAAETFTWNVGFIPENKLVLSFDIYLTGSLEGTRGRGTYITNNDNGNVYGATLTYTDIEGKSASEQVATPTIPWGGSQVSYGFYLVDENGNPITTVGGKPVAFDLAYKVKDKAIYEEFNNNDSATVDPKPVLPSGFALYDPSATYTVTSNEDGTGGWTITKDSGISRNTTFVTQFSSGGITSSNELSEKDSAYSYANTVVWFAVVLSDEIRGGESVVIDYGLPVDINVVADNKAHYDKIVALAKSAVNGNYSDELGEAFYNKGADGTITNVKSADGKFGTAAITSDTNITYTPKKTMEMYDVDVFTYAVERKSGETMFQKYAYETLTVIPAANIYYEDAFVDFATYKNEKDENGDKVSTENAWKDVTDINGTEGSADLSKNPQNQDRPGAAIQEIGNDADNVYGFDSRYENYATFSLGSAKKITVEGSIFGEAKFTFKGTGFDIISLTSNTTGAIVVQVKGTDANNKDVDRNFLVDTYYGYSYEQNEETKKWEWVVNKNSTDALYQIPVIKVDDLDYGTYEVTVLVSHISYIDKTNADGYEFYFDAVRIYDPAGIYDGVTSNNNQTIEDAYKNDNEAWPEYTELRNVINEANTIQSSVNKDGSTLAGSMFIDGCPTIANAGSDNNYAGGKPAGTQQWVNYLYFAGRYEYERKENVAPAISDYINYGPNNETYLAEGQAIAFTIDSNENLASVQIGLKAVKGATKINIYGVEKNGDNYVFTEVFNAKEINSATELYYDITALAGKTIVIMNAGDGEANTNPILSITNIKRTYKSEPKEEAETPKTNGIYIDTATVELALASFATVEVPAFEPDTFNVSVSKSSVKEGKTVTVTVKTSSDVDYITVNGEEVTKYKRSLFSRQRTWTYTVRANEAGEFPIDVVAYSADDIASVAVTKIINVTGTQTGGSSVGSSSSGSWLDKWFGGIFGKK